tara:strand:+ start:129 stop:299 length:171 start_codon:yes stop_codon:yes gene_type:complete
MSKIVLVKLQFQRVLIYIQATGVGYLFMLLSMELLHSVRGNADEFSADPTQLAVCE